MDGEGLYGSLFVYSLLAAMMGSHLIVFLVLWRKGRLDMEESPKYQMLGEEDSQ